MRGSGRFQYHGPFNGGTVQNYRVIKQPGTVGPSNASVATEGDEAIQFVLADTVCEYEWSVEELLEDAFVNLGIEAYHDHYAKLPAVSEVSPYLRWHRFIATM